MSESEPYCNGPAGDAVLSCRPAAFRLTVSDDRKPALLEPEAVRERYARRHHRDWDYHPLNPATLAAIQEWQRACAALFREIGWTDLSTRRLLEVGCGGGVNLLDLLRLGFRPENLSGIELQEVRLELARSQLPAGV